MGDRESHGMNCAYRSDNDEPCTCAYRHRAAVDTERTMHAAWRKRAEEAERENADLRARLAEAEKARDEQAEAVRVLGRAIIEIRKQRTYEYENNLVPGGCVSNGMEQACRNIINNPTAAAAV